MFSGSRSIFVALIDWPYGGCDVVISGLHPAQGGPSCLGEKVASLEWKPDGVVGENEYALAAWRLIQAGIYRWRDGDILEE